MGSTRNISQFSMQSGDQCPVPDFDGKEGREGTWQWKIRLFQYNEFMSYYLDVATDFHVL